MKRGAGVVLLSGILLITGIALIGCGHGEDVLTKAFDHEEYLLLRRDYYEFELNSYYTEETKHTRLFKGFSGVQTLWEIECEGEGVLHLDFLTSMKEGEFKTVLITPEKEIILLFHDERQGRKEITLRDGTHHLKIVGREASGTIAIELDLKKGQRAN